MAHIIDRKEWADGPEAWKGELECGAHGADVSLIFNLLTGPGGGPRLHQHPYPEIFIIRAGEGLFTVGESQIRAVAGQIIIVPADTPHKFTNSGTAPLETIDIHASGRFITEWLE
jgi:mannose-6-phosphate isomerase-like protein (cupin superfamily)